MNRTVCRSAVCALSALVTILSGCGSNAAQTPAVQATPAPGAPRPLNNLSQISPANPLSPFGKGDLAIARQVASEADTGTLGSLKAVGTARQVGDDKHPGEERLLNKKAAEFDGLSMRLMDQVFAQMMALTEQDEISHLKLPTDLKWVVITGTLDRKGVLKELLVEQHSGAAAIDKMVVTACKKGMSMHNPPPEALDADGIYKVRLEARIENYATEDGEHWEFKSRLGLALL